MHNFNSGALTQNMFRADASASVVLQDEWQLADRWSLALNVMKIGPAFGGGQRAGAAQVAYPGATTAHSPQKPRAFTPNDWTLRLSAGRGVRFPTVPSRYFRARAPQGPSSSMIRT